MSRYNVSVIAVNHNCYSTLSECVESILSSEDVGELLLVDNASTDGSMELMEKYNDDRLEIIRLNRNIGLPAARNLAASKTKSQYIAFVDADSKVEPHWLQEPCQLLETHKEYGAVQCAILSLKHSNKITRAKSEFDVHEHGSTGRERFTSNHSILYPIGAGFVIRRNVWNKVKGFDSIFFIGDDDIDLGIRIWLSGFEVIHSSEGIVFHDGGALRSRKDIAPIFRFYGEKNYLAMWMKNLQGRTIVKQVLPFSLLYPFRAFCRGGVEGVMGVVSFLEDLPSLLIRRNEVQRLRKVPDVEIMPLLKHLLPAQIFARDLMIFCRYISRRFRSAVQKFLELMRVS